LLSPVVSEVSDPGDRSAGCMNVRESYRYVERKS
jgi:hypothetical protein